MLKNKSTLFFQLSFSLIIIALFSSSLTLAQKRKPKPTTTPTTTKIEPVKPVEPETIRPPQNQLTVEEMEKFIAVIETSMGDITLEFYPKSAPNHVRQFLWLARVGYFDGMSFSRVLSKFIIQSGNPGSWEEASPNKKKRFDIPKLKAEYDPNIKHERGALSMARPNGDPDGGTSHFFICAQKASSLDNQYSIFGHVTKGIEVVETIAAVTLEAGTDKPADRIEVKHITIKEKEVDKPLETEQNK